ncbi:solute carrier family 13 member 2-like isoform X3 [Clavelina lepadiformis]|uniref:solute carrier family 13 member 2-like isoform X3 n=1 Tax=Clavelina lepadiformis TaxID=159417 RepID=UPI0040433A84
MIPRWLSQIWSYRITLVIVFTPLLLLPLPLVFQTNEASCGYVILLMAIYWITEAIPLAVTALLPLILFPVTGIMTAKAVSQAYFVDTSWLFIGGLIIAVAIERSNLHKRIALKVLILVGTKPRRLMFGFMVTTFFLSMWISNTATTAMMLPIVESVFGELKADGETHDEKTRERRETTHEENENSQVDLDESDHRNQTTSFDNQGYEPDFDEQVDLENTLDDDQEQNNCSKEPEQLPEERHNRLIKGITLCIPYSASIGGTATLTGTAPNLVLSGQFQILFPDAPQLLSFGSWFVYCIPGALLTLLLSYMWLCWLFLGFDFKDFSVCRGEESEEERKARNYLKTEHKALGSIRWAEGSVLAIFITTALLWFFRKPGFMPGWGVIFLDGYVSDGTVAITMAFLLFLLPKERPEFLKYSEDQELWQPVEALLDWPTMHNKFPWSVAFLLAGGFALARGATESGFSAWMGSQLAFLEGVQPWIICLLVTALVCLFTECSSNTATSSLFVPILANLAQSIEVHPLYLMFAPVLASSLAFMLPAATPPNAIAFSYGRLKVVDLVKAGWALNVMGVLVITLFINTYGRAYFGFGTFPAWAFARNASATNLTSNFNTTSLP